MFKNFECVPKEHEKLNKKSAWKRAVKQISARSHAVKQTCCSSQFLLQQCSHKVNYVLSTGYVQNHLHQQLYMYKCACWRLWYILLRFSGVICKHAFRTRCSRWSKFARAVSYTIRTFKFTPQKEAGAGLALQRGGGWATTDPTHNFRT